MKHHCATDDHPFTRPHAAELLRLQRKIPHVHGVEPGTLQPIWKTFCGNASSSSAFDISHQLNTLLRSFSETVYAIKTRPLQQQAVKSLRHVLSELFTALHGFCASDTYIPLRITECVRYAVNTWRKSTSTTLRRRLKRATIKSSTISPTITVGTHSKSELP